jgi:hypothetical protein
MNLCQQNSILLGQPLQKKASKQISYFFTPGTDLSSVASKNLAAVERVCMRKSFFAFWMSDS